MLKFNPDLNQLILDLKVYDQFKVLLLLAIFCLRIYIICVPVVNQK